MSRTTIDEFELLVQKVFNDEVRALVASAERTGKFPRDLIGHLGRTGVFREKWQDGALPDLKRLSILSRALGDLLSVGIGVGVSLHDSAIAVLRRFGNSDRLRDICAQAIEGTSVLCIGASEESGGSDLQHVTSIVAREGDGYRVVGRKKFVSLSSIASVALVVVRCEDGRDGGNVAVVALPAGDLTVGEPYPKLGAAPLDTAPVSFDAWIPDDALVARPGAGLAVISWGLAHERLCAAYQIAAAARRVLGITLARMARREQFSRRLYDHQALRLRMADLYARVDTLSLALDAVANHDRLDVRTAAAMKVTAAQLGVEVMGECLHMFGGSGYLTDETPVGRWWIDMKLARIGGGTDEVLWELVAAGMKADFKSYEELIESAQCADSGSAD
jgi:alkylation response protein AidB-like acyl-CoA dehydrogenase